MMDVDDLDDATLVAGVPRSGKTRFALDMLVAAMKRHGDAYAVMTVSGRQVADRLGDTVIRELSAISQARPVTTLPAVAFRIMTAVRSHAGQPLPKLLNGAEQDVVIRRVLARHAEHAEHGDECSTCALLRTYFVVADWSGMVVDDATDAFANQLRDMLARMNEIGATFFAILTLGLILTYSRGAWLSVCALIFFFGLFWDKRVWLLFLAGPLILAFYHGGVADRLMSIFSHSEADTSVSMRMDMWEAAIAMFVDHPVLGIGWGAFKHVYPVYNELIQEAGIVIFHAHNMYLNILAETGMAGLGFGLWFFFGNAWYAIRYVRSHAAHTFSRSLAMTLAAAVLSLGISGMSDYDLFSTQISLTFWLMSALFANMYGEECEKNDKNSLRNNSQ